MRRRTGKERRKNIIGTKRFPTNVQYMREIQNTSKQLLNITVVA